MLISKSQPKSITGVSRQKPQGGWGFFPLISDVASKKINPTPWGFCRDTPVHIQEVHYILKLTLKMRLPKEIKEKIEEKRIILEGNLRTNINQGSNGFF